MPDFNQVQGRYNKSSRANQYSKDCLLDAFSRCVEPLVGGEQGLPECHDMKCTPQKTLLIDGEPCDPSAPRPALSCNLCDVLWPTSEPCMFSARYPALCCVPTL